MISKQDPTLVARQITEQSFDEQAKPRNAIQHLRNLVHCDTSINSGEQHGV